MDYIEELEKYNIIKKGHFNLTSGRHSDTYINKDSIYCTPGLYEHITLKMARMISEEFICDVITGPAIAGAVLATTIAQFLGKTFIYPEKIDGNMVFRRGYDKILKNEEVVLVEDIITTGGSVNKTIGAIEECGGEVTGIIVIWNRTNWSTDKCKTLSIINEPVESWEPESCPLCAKNIPLQDPKEL